MTIDALGLMWLDMAMTRVKIAELKNNLSKYLRAVERGEEVEVTDRDRPIARIVPIRKKSDGITIIPPKRPFSEIRDKVYKPIRPGGINIVELLLEERGKR